jgi:hypothetical protein
VKILNNKIKFKKSNGEAKTINYQSNQVACREVGCKRRSFWIETDADGASVFCFRTRHDGENHAVKLSVAEIEEEIRKVL